MAKTRDRQIHEGRDLDRLINFTDAVVAVAITVLVLPIANLVATPSESTAWAVLSANSGRIITFFFTFAVVGVMWRAHNRVFNELSGFDNTIFWYNLAWLAAIVFLPVTSNLFGAANGEGEHGWSGGADLGGSGLLYWSSVALVAFWGSAIAAHARKYPDLTAGDRPLGASGDTSSLAHLSAHGFKVKYRGLIYASYFLLIGVVSLISPITAAYLPLGIIVLGRILR